MNYIKRATTSIKRRPGKTVILLLLVFILGSVIAGAISVENAISTTDANLRRNMQPLMSAGLDFGEWQRYLEQYDFDWETTFPPNEPRLTPADIRAIGSLEYVAFYDYVSWMQLRNFDLTREDQYGNMSMGWGDGPASFTLRGSTREEIIQAQQGAINIIQGNSFEPRHLERSETVAAVVSENFAERNNLSVGSVFTLSEWILAEPDEWGNVQLWGDFDPEEEELYATIELEFEIIGLFELGPADENDQDGAWRRLELLGTLFVPNWANEYAMEQILTATQSAFENSDTDMPFWIANQVEDTENQGLNVIPIFMLNDPADMDNFREAAAPLLPDFHEFDDMSSAFDDIASSMETMQTIANWILYVSIGATLLILSLLITLFLRDRRYEMGVYLALGEKKGRIVTQILMEILITSFVAITLSVFVGNIVSGVMSQNMLMNELSADAASNHQGGMMWSQPSALEQIGIPTQSLTVDEMMAQFDVSLDVQTIAIFYGIGLGAVVLSTLVPVVYVIRLKPKKVLM